MANKRGYGSIDVQVFLDIIASGHSSLKMVKKRDGGEKLVLEVTTWVNEKTNDKGQDGSVHTNGTKVAKDAGEKDIYILNWKNAEVSEPRAASATDTAEAIQKANELKSKLKF